MKKYKLGKIADIIAGQSPESKFYSSKEGIPFLQGNRTFGDKYPEIDSFTTKITKLAKKGSILISVRAPVGDMNIACCDTCIGRGIGAINSKDNLNEYLYYNLKNSISNLHKKSNGTTYDSITSDILSDYEVFIHNSYEERKRIGELFSSIDDKIALNQRINAKLESIAKCLYDYWFVQFDFPNADGKPYKSSGGKMVWNEALKREIPEGWEVKCVNDISTSYRGVGYSAEDEKTAEDNDVVLILRGNNISDNHIIFDNNTVYLDKSFISKEQRLNKYDILITMSSGSKEHVGKCAMFLFDSAHSYGAFCNKITPNKDCQFFLVNYLCSEYFKKYIKISCSGTGINNLTNDHFNKALFAFPPENILMTFNKHLMSLYEKQGVIEQEILKLTALRDKLLPLLMNEQVEVG